MADGKKCENPACTWPKGDRFRGAHCEALKGAVEVVPNAAMHPAAETPCHPQPRWQSS
jgi:hypothetical protein